MIRIVFVDDDENVLQAMGRSLRSMRSEWDMEFASSGPAALEIFGARPVDVIVCDMQMPGMDGWKVLAEVKTRSPQTVRLVLSGQAESGAIIRSVGAAHQYLAKPCDGASLKASITNIQYLRHLLSSERLATLAGGIDMLPGAPHIFSELLRCLEQPASSVTAVAGIVGRDVAMTANIMKLANSAFFGARRPITSIERAVAFLGLDTLGALVLGHSVFIAPASDTAAGFSHERLWLHSLQTAMTAKAIAIQENRPPSFAQEAFLAGLLHDVGKLVLATPAQADAAQTWAHHAEVGAYLLGLWGFQTPIVEAVAFHHAPDRAARGGFGLPGIIHVADRIARQGAGGAPDFGIEPGYLERLGLLDRLPQWSTALESAGADPVPA